MPSQANSSPSSSKSSGRPVPPIRTFQLSGGSIGNLPSNSVNLFRGDVNLNQTLFTLPGRTSDSELEVSLAVQYQSNVYRQSTTWNRDAPTGILGLGWSLPLTFIAATDQGSPVPSTRQYALYDNGSPNTLVRQAQAPLLFVMDAALAGSLHDGQPVPTAVAAELRGHGLALDAAAVVVGAGPWTIRDDVRQQLFTLALGSTGLEVRDGGEVYQLESYQFWKVVYYPPYERWVVVTDAGVRRSFGGTEPIGAAGRRDVVGNSIAWEVWWTDAAGVPVWTGTSAATEGQVQLATAWYLASVEDRFGNSVEYQYDTVEQQVGSGGLPFTKTIYLAQVTDVFGRTANLSYGEKLWQADDTAPREYADPHRAVPSDEPSPYQDRYETRYLDQIEIRDPSGGTLFTVRMTYDPRPEIAGPERAVANLTDDTGQLWGDTFKRFLTGITLYDQDGVPQPGLELGYYLDSSLAGAAPGALATVTYPEGGTATYAYNRQELDVCQRSLEVPRPAGVPAGAAPRVYFGPDYAAVCYYNQSSLELSLEIFTWAGSWLSWRLDPANPVLDTGGLDLETLEVLADQEVLVLTFDRSSPVEKAVYVFQRDVARAGQWQAATINGKTTARNQPPLVYSGSGTDLTFVGGDTFFAVAQMSRATLSGSYDVVTFRWTTRAWTLETVPTASYTWLTGTKEYYATLATDGRFVVHYLDATLAWQAGAATTVSGLATWDLDSAALVPGTALVAISNLQSGNQQQNTYAVWIARWNAAYGVTVSAFGPFTDIFGQNNAPTSWHPQVVGESMVAINGNLLRASGEEWLVNTALNPGMVQSGRTQRYTFGPDYAIQIIAPTTGVGAAEGKVLAFDPQRDSTSWNAQPATPKQALPPQTTATVNWPTAGGADYVVIGPHLYFRGTAGNWEAVVAQDALANLDALTGAAQGYELDSESLVNQAPGFLAYSATQGNVVQEVEALLLANGEVSGAPIPFGDQKMVTPGRDGVAGPGVSPAGPQLFVAYPAAASSLNSAASIFLHHYTDQAVSGPIVHYAVTGVVIEDGYQEPMPTAFAPDAATAGCDASGQVAKYFQATAFPGSEDPAAPRYGREVSYYLNGLEDLTSDNDDNMLDGMLIRSETYDNAGALKESTASTYAVYQQVALDPATPSAPPIQLRGGWVAQTEEVSFQDGVTGTVNKSYLAPGFSAPFTAQPVSVSTATYGGDGQAETFVEATTYGAQIDAGLRAIHDLTLPAQQTTTRQSGAAGSSVPIEVLATTYAPWPSALGEGVEATAEEATFGLFDAPDAAFPYSSYQPGDTPAGWVLAGRTTLRTLYGQERENVDSLGVPSATLFSIDDVFAVAKSANAAADGFAYLGFQPYEETAGWTLDGVVYDTSNARTGVRSARLPGGGASAAVTVIARNAECAYVAGCWYQTAPGYEPGAGAGWTVVITVDGVGRAPIEVPFADTGGEWAYQAIPVPLDAVAAGSAITIALSAANPGVQDVLLDCLLLVPLVNSFTARTFNQGTHLITSTMDAGGRTSRLYYDRAWRPTAVVGAAGQVRELAQRFLSRQGSPDDAFQPASPNAELTLHTAAGGVLETFRDGAAWCGRWQASPTSDWQEGDGALTHATAASGTLTWLGGPATGTYAAYFEVQRSGEPEIAITAGDVTIRWAGGSYSGQQGAESWTPLFQPPKQARHWLLVVGDGVVLFFGDGQLLFSEKTRPAGAAIVVTTNGAAATFRHLAVLEGVRVGLSYNDAASRQRQVQQLHGDDSLVAEQLFDPLGRQIATTRNASGSFGSGAALAVLQYSPGFVDSRAFVANLATTWEMHGDVADYYRGQSDGPIERSDDQGYPYRGTRYEDSPRDVELEQGRPGKPYAIDLAVPAAERQTLQWAWGANAGSPSDLPAGEYFRNVFTSPVKTESIQLTDQLGQLVATQFQDSAGALASNTSGSRAYSDDQGPESTLTTRLPNATTAGPQSDPDSYFRASSADGLERLTAQSDTDSGKTEFIADSSGRLRFVQPALGPGETWFIYYKYDPLGRMIEEGTVDAAWDREALTRLAEDQSYPTVGTAVSGVVSEVTEYDGDGAEPELIGKKHRTATHNPAPADDPQAGACTVTETFGYDSGGRLISVRMQIEGAAEADGTVVYAHDTLGEVIRVDMPAGAPLATVFYTYDDQGQVVAVGTTPGGTELGAFTYDPDGAVQTSSLGGGAWEQAFTYASPGWALAMSTRSAAGDKSLDFSYSYEADGAVANREVAYAFPGATATVAATFAYDGQRRLLSTTGSNNVQMRQYDPNGNPWSVEQDGVVQEFPLVAGSDRLAQATIGGDTSSVAYNARGQMISGLGRTLTYDRANAMTTSITTADAGLRLAYNGTEQRAFKQVRAGTGRDVVYFNGAGQVPIARLADGAWSVLVQGPTGILAVQSNAGLRFPLVDITGSTWAVVDDAGSLAARYVYLPFGQQVVADGPEAAAYAYLYQGQEWDAEVALYNFRARMYDPVLRRFLAPDPARQFPSLYVFAGNNPLTATDPTGAISLGGQIGIAIASVLITAIGVGLSIFTGGASSAAVATAKGVARGTKAAAKGTSTAVKGASKGAAAAKGASKGASKGAAAATKGAAGATEVAAGASATETAATTTSWTTRLGKLAGNVAGSTLSGAGTSGLKYDIQHGRDFTAQGFFEAMGIGAASGFVKGVVSGGGGLGLDKLTGDIAGKRGVAARIVGSALVGGTASVLSSDVSTILTNVAQHEPWYQGLAKATVKGFGKGTASGAASGAWSERIALAKMAGVSDQTMQKVSTLPARTQAAAKSVDGKSIFGAAEFFMIYGYKLQGSAGGFGEGP